LQGIVDELLQGADPITGEAAEDQMQPTGASSGSAKLIELEMSEVEFLKKIHNAKALQELTQHPGWEIYTGIVKNMIAAWEDQHLEFAPNASETAYWISGVRLAAARQFSRILTEQITQKIDLLKQPLRTPRPMDTADFDGDVPRNGHQPDGDMNAQDN
jgi:hypothetical protein